MKITHITTLALLLAASVTTSFAGRGPEVRFANEARQAPVVKQMDQSKQMAKSNARTPHSVKANRTSQAKHKSTMAKAESAACESMTQQ